MGPHQGHQQIRNEGKGQEGDRHHRNLENPQGPTKRPDQEKSAHEPEGEIARRHTEIEGPGPIDKPVASRQPRSEPPQYEWPERQHSPIHRHATEDRCPCEVRYKERLEAEPQSPQRHGHQGPDLEDLTGKEVHERRQGQHNPKGHPKHPGHGCRPGGRVR